jgi:hypothetical protein
MLLSTIRRWFAVAVLVVMSFVSSTFGVSAKSLTPANQYGPVTVTVTSQCPNAQTIVNMPIDPSQIPSITLSGQVNGSVHLYDQNGLINTNVTGSAPYSFTTKTSDVLYACLTSGNTGTVSFQGQLNEFSGSWAGYAVQGFNASPNHYSMVLGTWDVPAVSCGVGETSGSATWVGLGGAPNTGSQLIEQIGTYQNCATGIRIYVAAYESYQPGASPNIILFACSDGSYSSCNTVPATVASGDFMLASVTSTGNGNFNLFIHDETQAWHVTEPQSQTNSTVEYTAEWIEEAPNNGVQLANFGSVTFNNCTVDNVYPILLAGPIIQQLPMIRATPSALGGAGNWFSVTFNSH